MDRSERGFSARCELKHGADGIEAFGVPLRRRTLVTLRSKARRCGAWFRRLDSDERRYIELVIVLVDRVRSPLVAKILAPPVEKLPRAIGGIGALESEVARWMKTVGHSLAEKIGLFAQRWGNRSAARWGNDRSFIQYLSVNEMNLSPLFRTYRVEKVNKDVEQDQKEMMVLGA